ncbi:MAG: penicillin acylase family protein [Gammaproteobacteria bacterium]|nr:penicillin acylase family protein [Gammaproteobacteria bacterium]
MNKAIGGALFILLVVGGCTTNTTRTDTGGYTADIRWTSHGIPHIRAFDWYGAAYGLAYAVATDAVCVLAEEFVTVRGERARYFSSNDASSIDANIDSDIFHRALLDDHKVRSFLDDGDEKTDNMLAGYVAGYNRFIDDQKDSLPTECEGADWIKPITREDLARLTVANGIRYGLGRVKSAIARAAPGARMASIEPAPGPSAQGSNAVAFGRALTASGRGILLGNPHYPWHGPSRFHMAHITIPGEVDVMGVGLITTPSIAIGFNRHVAWTHTVSTALRFTLFRLELDPNDPMRYRLGDEYRDIEARDITVDLKNDDGSLAHETRTVYSTHLGPIVSTKELTWGPNHVYVMRDANYENHRGTAQYLDLNRAESVAEVKAALSRHQGVSFVNTIAADRRGGAFYADMSAMSFVTAPQVKRCRVGPEQVGGRNVIVLDGSRPDCNWQSSPDAAGEGIMPPHQQPSLTTDKFVSNSNDSHWLTSPDAPLEGFSPIIGDERTPRLPNPRRSVFVDELLREKEAVTPRDVPVPALQPPPLRGGTSAGRHPGDLYDRGHHAGRCRRLRHPRRLGSPPGRG